MTKGHNLIGSDINELLCLILNKKKKLLQCPSMDDLEYYCRLDEIENKLTWILGEQLK